MIDIDAFLTAYNPSDLPGESIDPLGFERAYLLLADKILPGLTNVANRPRYFGVLCAGVRLANVDATDTPRRIYQARLDAVLRLERLWALANVLVTREAGEEEYPFSGIRGLRYAERKARELESRGATATRADFQLLVRQAPYGVIGIYGAVAERLRFLSDRKLLDLTDELGDRLGDAFMTETEMPREIRDAVATDKPVSLRILREWGERSHVSGNSGEGERECLRVALRWNPVRERMIELLERQPKKTEESELDRLGRISRTIERRGTDRELLESIRAAVHFERAYAWTLLGFERLLWVCRHQAAVPARDLSRDPVLSKVRGELSIAAQEFEESVESAQTEHFRGGMDRAADVRSFLRALVASADRPVEFVREMLARHRDIQHGKFDRGRRKAPWIEISSGAISLTSTRVGGAAEQLTEPDDIVPHYYRTDAADALRGAGVAV